MRSRAAFLEVTALSVHHLEEGRPPTLTCPSPSSPQVHLWKAGKGECSGLPYAQRSKGFFIFTLQSIFTPSPFQYAPPPPLLLSLVNLVSPQFNTKPSCLENKHVPPQKPHEAEQSYSLQDGRTSHPIPHPNPLSGIFQQQKQCLTHHHPQPSELNSKSGLSLIPQI